MAISAEWRNAVFPGKNQTCSNQVSPYPSKHIAPTLPLHIGRAPIGSGRRNQKGMSQTGGEKVQVTQKLFESLKDPHTCDLNLDFLFAHAIQREPISKKMSYREPHIAAGG